MRPVRVLYLLPCSLTHGTIASYALSYISRFDPSRVHVDIAVPGSERGPLEPQALAYGCTVYHLPVWRKEPLRYARHLKLIFDSGGYEVAHAHMDAHSAFVLFAAKRAKVPVRIAHCHNPALTPKRFWRGWVEAWLSKRTAGFATHLAASSETAARFLYGSKRFEAGRVTLFRAGLDPDECRFDADTREEVRSKLVLTDRFVIGSVAPFTPAHNQAFLLDTFAVLSRRMPEATLLLVGEGPQYADILLRIRRLGVEEQVRLLGEQTGLPRLMQAFDLYAAPARASGGLPVELILAQATGLFCLASTEITAEAQVGDCTFLPLSDAAAWVREMTAAREKERAIVRAGILKDTGYDIADEAARMERFYERVSDRLHRAPAPKAAPRKNDDDAAS